MWSRLSRPWKRRLVLVPSAVVASVVGAVVFATSMPGESHRGPLPPLTDRQKTLAAALREDVVALAGDIGDRNLAHEGTMAEAEGVVRARFEAAGHTPVRLPYAVAGVEVANLEVTVRGAQAPDEIVVVGAHYDTAEMAPGADDNGSGVAMLLALARRYGGRGPEPKPAAPAKTLRLVAFANEEPPHFWKETMGSLVYAKACKARGDRIVAMVSLESLGYYSDREGSQKYPPGVDLLYPSRGNFVAFVGNTSSRGLVRRAVGTFREAVRFPSDGAALPGFIPGVGWSDQWSFWEQGYDGVMLTDTATFRNPTYHTPEDNSGTIDYESMARVFEGVEAVVADLVR